MDAPYLNMPPVLKMSLFRHSSLRARQAARAIHFMSPFSPAAAKIGYMDLTYPIGKFDFKQTVTPGQHPARIARTPAAPALFREAGRGLDEPHPDTPYRPGG